MNEPREMSWKAFTIRLIEALRWPAAFIAAAVIFQDQVGQLVSWITGQGAG